MVDMGRCLQICPSVGNPNIVEAVNFGAGLTQRMQRWKPRDTLSGHASHCTRQGYQSEVEL
jgi:putative hemolysin